MDNSDLTSMRLEQVCSTSNICAILKQESIYLKHVVKDVGVFDYLCSYSGLETLDLCSMSFCRVEEFNSSARTFYKSVLPQLVHSLEVLKIEPKQEGRWCFNFEDDFQSAVFPQCNKLRSLSVTLSSTSFLRSINFFSRDCVLHQYKNDLDDTVCLVISLFSPCHNKVVIYCRSHHSSTYRSAYPLSVKFALLYRSWHSRVMSLSWVSQIW